MRDGDLTAQDAQYIAGYLLIERTALKPADIGLVFGNKFICAELAATAADLYRQGYFSKILVTGGVMSGQDGTEAAATRAALLRAGIPDSAILGEDRSTNTQENVIFAREVAARVLGPDKVKSVIGIGHISAGRRFLMTLARHWPDVFAMHVSVNPYATPASAWHTNDAFRQQVMKEWAKATAYIEKDYITEIDIGRINRLVETAGQNPPEKSRP